MARSRERFSSRIAALCETFERDVTKGLLEAYWLALNDLSEADLDRAVATLLRSSRFMPRPAEIRDAAGKVESIDVRANEAWLEVRPLISEDGGALVDPLAELVVQSLGGWSTLGNRTEEENSTWTRKEFLRLYEAYAQSPKAMEALEHRAKRLAQRDSRQLSDGFESWHDPSNFLPERS